MSTIDISNVGPIEAVSIPVPTEGGVVVLRGPNGAGKTIALSAVDALTREGSTTPKARARDGSLGGSVEGLGRTIRVGLQRSTVRGELEVSAIGDDVDVSSLVDPGLKDPAAADRARIKAALVLAQVDVDVAPFADLVGGLDILKSLVRSDTLAAGDPVEMAERVRRDLHNAALTRERAADACEATAKGLRESLTQPAEPLNEDAIRAESEEAVALRRELTQRQLLAEKNAKQRAEARAAIEAAGPGPDFSAVETQVVLAEQEAHDAQLAEDDAREAFENAKQRNAKAKIEAKAARDLKTAAEAFAVKMDRARQALDSIADVDAPTQDQIDEAGLRVVKAHEAVERLGLLREEQRRREDADKAAADAEASRGSAAQLREAAKATDEVLAALLAKFAPAGLSIHDGRLVLTRDGKAKFFADLSDGERWRIALDLAIDALGEARILAISQLAWEGLDADARAAINAHAHSRKTVIVTAEADHEAIGKLRAEKFLG